MDGKWKGWEVWRFIKDDSGDFIITSWTHDQKVLCSDGDGRVYTVNMKDLIEEGRLKSQQWKIINHSTSHGVRIQSVTSFGVAKASNGLDNGLEGIKLDEPSNNLPLCAWRMWA